MLSRTRPLAALLVALLVAGAQLLTGCSEEEPTPKIAAEPSASPTVVVKEETAEEFIRRWAKTERDMQNTGDTKEYRALTQGCESCARLADRVEKIYAAGGEIETAGSTVESTQPLGKSQHLVLVNNAPTSYRESSDGALKSYQGGESKYVITLKKKANEFVLTDMFEQSL